MIFMLKSQQIRGWKMKEDELLLNNSLDVIYNKD